MARPDKLTPERMDRIVTAIRAGNTREAAAQYAGVGETTLYRWLQTGRRSRNGSKCRELWEAVKEAENDAELESVLIIREAARKSWQAAAWWLERRKHGAWGRKESLDITIRREAEKIAKETGLDVEEIMAEAERIVAA